MSFFWSDEGGKSYVSRAKEAVLDWAAENSGKLQTAGDITRFAGLGAGGLSLAIMKYLGTDDPGIISKFMDYAGAPFFMLSESMKGLGQYARDRENGETDPVKNAGYVTRILAPIEAIIFGSNGVWEPGYDAATPVIAWAGGEGLTHLGNRRILKEKTAEAEKAVKWFDEKFGSDGVKYLMDQVKRFNPRADIDVVARHMPLNELKNLPEYLNDLLRDENEPRIY